MTRLPVLRLALAAVAGAVISILATAPAGASHPTPASPHIAVHPKSAMVNSSVMLVGTNFAPRQSLTVKECSQTSWIVPQDPCNDSTATVVQTNGHGKFKSSFTVKTCPAASSAPTPGFAEKCYIGVPMPQGIDTMTLVGAAAVTVTGP